jgi:hypothetical protein
LHPRPPQKTNKRKSPQPSSFIPFETKKEKEKSVEKSYFSLEKASSWQSSTLFLCRVEEKKPQPKNKKYTYISFLTPFGFVLESERRGAKAKKIEKKRRLERFGRERESDWEEKIKK